MADQSVLIINGITDKLTGDDLYVNDSTTMIKERPRLCRVILQAENKHGKKATAEWTKAKKAPFGTYPQLTFLPATQPSTAP